jgi:hypothetical protein
LPVALGDAVHAPLAGVAADPGAERVAAAGLGGGHLGIAGVAPGGAGGLGVSQVARSIGAGWEGCGDQSHSVWGTGRFLPVMVGWVQPVPSGEG